MKSNGLIFAAGVAIIVMMGNGINGKLDSINEKVGLYDGEHKVVIEKLRTLENNQKIIMDWKEQHTRDEISENHGTKYIETRRNNK
jgi:activator of HSP90 ATPase